MQGVTFNMEQYIFLYGLFFIFFPIAYSLMAIA